VPALPREYVTLRRGPLAVAYPSRIEPQARAAIAHAEGDARAAATQLGLFELPRLEVRLVPDPAAMRQLAPAEAPPPAYATGVAAGFVGVLMDGGKGARFAVLVTHLRAGLDLDAALRQTYGASLLSLEHDWRRNVEVRFLSAPLWAGTRLFWMAGMVLLVVAF